MFLACLIRQKTFWHHDRNAKTFCGILRAYKTQAKRNDLYTTRIVAYVLSVCAISTCRKHEPQQHVEVQRGCGCSLVSVDFEQVRLARVLGMFDSSTTLWHYNSNAKRSAGFQMLIKHKQSAQV